MLTNSTRRKSVIGVEFAVVTYVLAGSFVALWDPACRARTLLLICEAVGVGLFNSAAQYLAMMHTFANVHQHSVASKLLSHHLKFALVGALLLSIALSLIASLLK